MGKVVDTEFFRKTITEPTTADGVSTEALDRAADESSANDDRPAAAVVTASHGLTECIRSIVSDIKEKGQQEDAAEITRIYNDAVRERFCIAVVGEFSRGKSTFVNQFLGRKIVPAGNLPTTAVITHIRYSRNEMIVMLDKNGKKQCTLPTDISSWEGYTIDLNGGVAEGTAVVGLNIPMLKKYSMEIIDTPGAGDLEEGRMRVVGEMLLGCDGAIIAVSAVSPLSMSEKLFIEERLIARKTPYLILVITKLDQVPADQRARVIKFIKEKLALWKIDIPVYIPANVEVPGGEYDDNIGIEKVRKAAAEWVCDPERKKLTTEWIADRTAFVLKNRVSLLNEQLLLAQSDKSTQEALIKEKHKKLAEAENHWENLKIKMLSNCNYCCDIITDMTDECAGTIIERLQYELSHAQSPQKWWEEDYPYRLKIELTNMAVSLNKSVTSQITQDAAWFNNALEKSFKTHVLSEHTTVMDKGSFGDMEIKSRLEFDNIERQRNIARIGTVALSLAGALMCVTMGFSPFVATMGVGTGAGIISEKVFKNKIDRQREDIGSVIERSVPLIISDSVSDSVSRVRSVYDDMIERATRREEEWLRHQKQMTEDNSKPTDSEQLKDIREQIALYSGSLEKLAQL